MQVHNVHEREFPLPPATVGALIDTLASSEDRLWPKNKWHPMRFDRPLAVGAVGGHGPVRYTVVEYQPGKRIVFRFTGPSGFNGTHHFEVEERAGKTVLRHVILMRAEGNALLNWPLLVRFLHDACIEDCFDQATLSLGLALPHPARWSFWVRTLRAGLGAVSRKQ